MFTVSFRTNSKVESKEQREKWNSKKKNGEMGIDLRPEALQGDVLPFEPDELTILSRLFEVNNPGLINSVSRAVAPRIITLDY